MMLKASAELLNETMLSWGFSIRLHLLAGTGGAHLQRANFGGTAVDWSSITDTLRVLSATMSDP